MYVVVDKYERPVDPVQEGTIETIWIWIHLSIVLFPEGTDDIAICITPFSYCLGFFREKMIKVIVAPGRGKTTAFHGGFFL